MGSAPRIQRSVRTQELVRGGWGLALLVAPDRVGSLLGVGSPNPRTRAVARVLGARHLAQALVTAAAPRWRVLRYGGLVDLAHASTGLALAATDPHYRRPALTDAAIATGFGMRGLHAGTELRPATATTGSRPHE